MFADYALFIPFIAIVCAAVYFQTVTGFGLSMIIMGMSAGLGLASVADLANIISIITVVNSAVFLKGNMALIDWKIARAAILGVVPASVAGVVVLDYLSVEATGVLQLLLGAVIVYGGINFAWRPRQLPTMSPGRGFVLFGLAGGMIGGLFGIPGPPLIFHFYRQPMSLSQVRAYLLLLFAVIAGARTLFVIAQNQLTTPVVAASALCIPVVAVATMAGRRFPPPFANETMRRIAFVTLIMMGLGLFAPLLGNPATA